MLKFQFAKLDSEYAGNVLMTDQILKIMASYCVEFHMLASDKKDFVKKKDIKLKKYLDEQHRIFLPKRIIFTGKEFILSCTMQLPKHVDSQSTSVKSDRSFITFYLTPTKSDTPEHLTLLTLDKDLDFTIISTIIYGMTVGKCITSEFTPDNESMRYFSQELYNGIAGKYKGARKELLKNIQDVL